MPEPKPAPPPRNRPLTALLLALIALNILLPLHRSTARKSLPALHATPPPAAALPTTAAAAPSSARRPANASLALAAATAAAKRAPSTWLPRLRVQNPRIRTARIGCREYDAGAQSCVYEGVICVNGTRGGRPRVYFADDTRKDGERVPSDLWCAFRHQSSDPRYFASRHWPIREGLFAPQRTCLDAYYRRSAALLGGRRLRVGDGVRNGGVREGFDFTFGAAGVRWVDSLWLVDLDYRDHPHNNHLLKDMIWLLDVMLWQDSLSVDARPGHAVTDLPNDTAAHLFAEGPRHVYLPQSRADFVKQTKPDINRLTYALVLQQDLTKLYPNSTAKELRTPAKLRQTIPLLEAYPHLDDGSRLIFHRDIVENTPQVDMTCAPRFTAGAKIGNGGHERVCRSLRARAHALFGIKEPPMKRLGRVYFPQPPKRIIVLQRHIRRGIANLAELEKALRKNFEKRYGVEVEIVSTKDVVTAEDQVRLFARAGVLFTSHGGQSMGQIWMPRHSSLIEVMPVGYTDYNFQILSESCKIWYYELQSLRHPGKSVEYYDERCSMKKPHMFNPCVPVKYVDVVVDIEKTVKTIRLAMERMGYPMDPWMEFVNEG